MSLHEVDVAIMHNYHVAIIWAILILPILEYPCGRPGLWKQGIYAHKS